MHFSTQFEPLFRRENYAVGIALYSEQQYENAIADVLASSDITGLWDMQYSLVPFGELSGRKEGEDIQERNAAMGYSCYGAQCVEAQGKISLTEELANHSRQFTSPDGGVDEPRFAGHIADTYSRMFLTRRDEKFRKLASLIFNLGGIQAGNAFFNQHIRSNGHSAVPNSPLIYDGSPLFATPANSHQAYADNATVGKQSAPTGNFTDMGLTIADTGGYFNAWQLPPSEWALERVWRHWIFNMQFDENNERYHRRPDTLLISSYNLPRWVQILQSKIIEPRGAGGSAYSTNRVNFFSLNGYKLRLVDSPDLIANTWFLGKANGGGIKIYNVPETEDPFSLYRQESNRSYWMSFEDRWGFIVRNWRDWCAGAVSLDGETPPDFDGTDKTNWDSPPAGI